MLAPDPTCTHESASQHWGIDYVNRYTRQRLTAIAPVWQLSGSENYLAIEIT
jgi:hypothetical protein